MRCSTKALVALFVVLAAAPRAAHAEGAPDVKAAAQALFEEGRTAVREGRFAEACGKLEESQRLDPGIGTQLWLADCYENNGQPASAWAAFKGAAAASALKHDPREQIARERAAALEGKLPRLTIAVPTEAALPGLEVRRDGSPAGAAQWGIGVPVDPGVHTITARAPGRRAWATTVQVPAGAGSVRVDVPALESAPEAQADPSIPRDGASNATDARDASAAARSPTGSTQRWIGVGVACVGLVGLGVGTYYSLSAKSAYDASNDAGHCAGNQCDAVGKDDRRTAFDRATVSTIAFAAGAAAVAGGAVLFLTARRDAAISVGPSVGGGAVRFSRAW